MRMDRHTPRKTRARRPFALWLAVAALAAATALGLWRPWRAQPPAAAVPPASPAATASPEATSTAPPEAPTIAPTPAPWHLPYARESALEVDWAALQRRNGAIYAWIRVPGSAIDYPVVYAYQGDTQYLDHNAYLEEDPKGAIFVEGWNNFDFSDPLTLLFGHNMKDGSMFAALHRFRDSAFFDDHQLVYLDREGQCLTYRIFTAYIGGAENPLSRHDFSVKSVWAEFQKTLLNHRDLTALVREGVPLGESDRVIQLVTCLTGQDDKRVFVGAVLLDMRQAEALEQEINAEP